MTIKQYLIAPESEGLVNNLEPWLIPDEAYAELQNMYVWRGRLRKRFGFSYFSEGELSSRLRVNIGTTNGAGALSTTVPGSTYKIGQMFSIGTEIFTVYQDGPMLNTGSATLATYDLGPGVGAGDIVINGADATTACYFYPAEPVMGLRLRETANHNYEETIGFDQQFAYQRSGAAWERLGDAEWTGSDSQFFWTTNYRGANIYTSAFWVVNNKAYSKPGAIEYNGIKFVNAGSSSWTTIRPQLNTSGTIRYLEGAKIILGFKDRILCLSTIEEDGGTQTYQNRARWSQNGDPTNNSTSWLDTTVGVGGYNDATTEEAIISAEFVKDRLIVYFERSTWELVYTGDYTLPFRWQLLDNELGAESPFSIIGFDQKVVGVGNVGIHSCNGTNVVRIDEKIPDEVFKIHNGNSGTDRVYGIRDYYNELVYWTFPNAIGNPTFPNRILVWNYQNNCWSFFDNSFTCFGYFQKDSTLTWAKLGTLYGNWENWNDPWGAAPSQSQFPDVVAGNQQGFTFIINSNKSSTGQSLYITNYSGNTLIVVDHNLSVGDYILIEDCQGAVNTNDTVVVVQTVTDANTITVDGDALSGTYTGGGKLTQIPKIKILSKQWNPGTSVGRQFYMNYIDFLLDRTVNGELSLDYYADFNSNASIQDQVEDGVLLGNNILTTQSEGTLGESDAQTRIWHRFYTQVEGQTLQIKIYLSDDQLRDVNISQSQIQLNGLILYISEAGRLTGA